MYVCVCVYIPKTVYLKQIQHGDNESANGLCFLHCPLLIKGPGNYRDATVSFTARKMLTAPALIALFNLLSLFRSSWGFREKPFFAIAKCRDARYISRRIIRAKTQSQWRKDK